MLEIIIVFGIFSALMTLVSKPYVKKIETAPTVEEALDYRKRLKWLRWMLAIFFVLLYFGIGFWLNHDPDFWLNGKGKNAIAVLFAYLVTQKGFKSLRGNVSSFDKETFLKKYPKFSLYLRGFEDDAYGVVVESETTEKFSELNFMEELEKYVPACAIGMTKEAEAPFGAKRVYVSDESWKEDVRDLMNRAHSIFVLLNDRPSCIWEIEQSVDVLGKTCFLVEDINKYNVVRENLLGKIDFPAQADLGVEVPFALKFKANSDGVNHADGAAPTDSNKTTTLQYENSKEGYEELLSLLIKGVTTKTKSREVSKKIDSLAWKVLKIIGYILAIFILLALDLHVSDLLMDVFGTYSTPIKWIFVVLLVALECAIYLTVKTTLKRKKSKDSRQ